MRPETRDEKTLLLFLETCAVDHSGRIDIRHMNKDDVQIAEAWHHVGYIEFGRIAFKNITGHYTNFVKLSDEAVMDAHQLRKERAMRCWNKRTWMTAKEYRTKDDMDTTAEN